MSTSSPLATAPCQEVGKTLMLGLARIVAVIVAAVCFVVVLFFDPKGTTLGPAELLAVGDHRGAAGAAVQIGEGPRPQPGANAG